MEPKERRAAELSSRGLLAEKSDASSAAYGAGGGGLGVLRVNSFDSEVPGAVKTTPKTVKEKEKALLRKALEAVREICRMDVLVIVPRERGLPEWWRQINLNLEQPMRAVHSNVASLCRLLFGAGAHNQTRGQECVAKDMTTAAKDVTTAVLKGTNVSAPHNNTRVSAAVSALRAPVLYTQWAVTSLCRLLFGAGHQSARRWSSWPSVVTWVGGGRENESVTKDVTKEAGKNVSASDENTVSHENTGSALAARFAQAQELGAHEEGELV
jgi:hypothetical protein